MKKNHLELLEKYTIRKPYKIRMAKVKCDCGTVKDIQWWSWNSGKVKSCGCMRLNLLSEAVKPANPIYSHRLHNIWTGMKQRCYEALTTPKKTVGRPRKNSQKFSGK